MIMPHEISRKLTRRAVLATSAVFLTLAATSADAATVLRLAHASSTDSLVNQAVTRFADLVAERTAGEVEIRIFPNGQLGDEGPIAEGVGSGSIDIGLGGVVDSIDPKLGVVTLPFLFDDAKAAHAFLDGPVGAEVFDTGAERGYRMLGALDSGFRQFAAVDSPITAPQDLDGLKVRTPPNPVILATMKQLGALPQSVPFGEVYTALQSGVVDAVEPEIRDFYDQKWFEVVKNLSISNYIWTPNYWFMNKARYDDLPQDQQQAIDGAVAETTAWYRSALDSVYSDVLGQLKGQGVAVNEVDTAPFRAMVDPVYVQFGQEWGEDFVQMVRKAAAGTE